ncbi:hypothetical protein PSYAR_12799 [Pseudomonas syringae pv. aceris str. M302273]|nr:hypothetical protein PSYAR_12799 [Pseudomonas syringae pv. aceris str. M302273]KOG03591.1 Uncharacterized protein ABJ98_2429 [Pseudomonas syringae pv. aceris]
MTGDSVLARSLAGHARLDTTSRYLNAKADQMHSQLSESLEISASSDS